MTISCSCYSSLLLLRNSPFTFAPPNYFASYFRSTTDFGSVWPANELSSSSSSTLLVPRRSTEVQLNLQCNRFSTLFTVSQLLLSLPMANSSRWMGGAGDFPRYLRYLISFLTRPNTGNSNNAAKTVITKLPGRPFVRNTTSIKAGDE